jgi:nucleotide-binding universal stress UspA family protein
MQRLLLAYDGSKRAEPALSWTSLLQRTLPAEVVVVAVQENGVQSTDDWLAEAQAQLADCQCLHRLGQPASEIVATAEETQADMIIMGRYRYTALLERFMGSTIDRVLRGISLPVLMA